MNIFNLSVIARKQSFLYVTRAQHASYLQNVSRHKGLHAFVCKLGCELYCIFVEIVLAHWIIVYATFT